VSGFYAVVVATSPADWQRAETAATARVVCAATAAFRSATVAWTRTQKDGPGDVVPGCAATGRVRVRRSGLASTSAMASLTAAGLGLLRPRVRHKL